MKWFMILKTRYLTFKNHLRVFTDWLKHHFVAGNFRAAGLLRHRAIAESHHHQNLGAEGFAIEFDRLFATAVEG